jgi:uncharacterized protein (TIGR02147 family)
MSQAVPYYRTCLQTVLAHRCEKNPRYSLRSLARALGIGAGTLSQFLSGKRTPSYRTAVRMLSHLGLEPGEERDFMQSLAIAVSKRGLKRVSPALRNIQAREPFRDLAIDHFRIIADWYHYAILMLTLTDGFQENPRWIAAQLGISEIEAKLAVERLLACELLLRTKSGRLRCEHPHITTADKHLTTAALRRHQKQVLEKAMHSLENDSIERRSMTSMTMAVSPSRLGEARKLIEEFTRRLNACLEEGPCTEVYQLGISLFPLQASPPRGAS